MAKTTSWTNWVRNCCALLQLDLSTLHQRVMINANPSSQAALEPDMPPIV
jgi:hypothetical protein